MFQSTVNNQLAPALPGDFTSKNPRATILAGAGQFIAPAGGLIVGNFCFVNPADGTVHQAYSAGYEIGFLGRNQQGLVTTFLADNVYAVPQGAPITLYSAGDFWANFVAAAPAGGVPVYANTATGAAQVALAGGVLTQFILRSIAAAGENAKISAIAG